MPRALLLLFIALISAVPARALDYPLLAGLDFTQGNWSLIGVSLHNAAPIPEQTEWGTFMITDRNQLLAIQEAWRGPLAFNDFCDYHYAIKLYKDDALVKTILLNLRCNYATTEGLAYTFTAEQLHLLKPERRLPWSRIRFTDMERVRLALARLPRHKQIFFYEPYAELQYDGFVTLALNGRHWREPRVQLMDSLSNLIEASLGHRGFHLEEYAQFTDDAITYDYRYKLYLNEPSAQRLPPGLATLSWQAHLAHAPHIQLIVVGINERDYRRIMNQINAQEPPGAQ